MPVTGSLILGVFGIVVAAIGAVSSSGLLLVGTLIAVVSLGIASREFLTYRAQRRHLDSKKNAKLETSGHLDATPLSESRIEAFLDSQPPAPKP